jgi:hypothetical protein
MHSASKQRSRHITCVSQRAILVRKYCACLTHREVISKQGPLLADLATRGAVYCVFAEVGKTEEVSSDDFDELDLQRQLGVPLLAT